MANMTKKDILDRVEAQALEKLGDQIPSESHGTPLDGVKEAIATTVKNMADVALQYAESFPPAFRNGQPTGATAENITATDIHLDIDPTADEVKI